jgi:putative sigma-54 modulation protein
VSGHHAEVSPGLREYVGTKRAKLERHFDHLTDIHCVLTVEKLAHKAEATVHVTGGTIHADSVEMDMYAAIDGLIDKLETAALEPRFKPLLRYVRKLTETPTRMTAQDAAAVYDALLDGRVTLFFGVPTMYARLLREAEGRAERPRPLRLYVSGSAPLSPQAFEEFERLFGERILERYGMTETLMNTAVRASGERRPGRGRRATR